MRNLLFFMICPVLVMASETAEYDIVARTINFILFAGIMYYFLANPIKNAYKGRIASIENKLNAIRDKVLSAQEKTKSAINEVEIARKRADELIEIGTKQALALAEKIELDAQNEIKFLKNNFEEQKDFARRVALKNTINDILFEIFGGNEVKIDQKDLVNLIIKKVS